MHNQVKQKKAWFQKKERYDIFLIPALLFFVLGFILNQGRIVRRGTFFLILFLSIHILPANEMKQLEMTINEGFYGNKFFEKQEYNKALEKYEDLNKLLDERIEKE